MEIEVQEGNNISVDVIDYDGKKCDVLYIQEPRRGNRGELTVAITFLDGLKSIDTIPVIAVAERGPLDRHSYELGRKVVYGRLKKKLNEIKSIKSP